jgi:hypothetical protein
MLVTFRNCRFWLQVDLDDGLQVITIKTIVAHAEINVSQV